jgi:hypothetical protein
MSLIGVDMVQYKIFTQKDKWFSTKFDPEKLEQALNAYAQQGWRIVTCATPSFEAQGRNEFVAVLERRLD